MIDGIIKANGTSRLMRAELPATYEEFRAQCHVGAQPLDVLFNALGWSQLPTFLNKANLLKDTTSALFGLGANAVPDDVFAFVGKYNLHWWKMRGYGAHYESFVQSNDEAYTISVPSSGGADFYYSDAITVSQTDGKISLVNPKSFHVEWGQGSYDKAIGKYVCRNEYQNVSSVLKFDRDVTYSAYGSGSSLITTFKGGVQTIIGVYVEETTDWQFVYSEDSEAYPKSGVVSGFEYQYLGVPFDNAVTAPKIATGSYIGTGTYGASKPNSLTFDFKPKIWGIYQADTNTSFNSVLAILPFAKVQPTYGVSVYPNGPTSSAGYWHTDVSGNTVTWWDGANRGATPNAQTQANASGCTYYWFAIG